jgi:hypothetical protein
MSPWGAETEPFLEGGSQNRHGCGSTDTPRRHVDNSTLHVVDRPRHTLGRNPLDLSRPAGLYTSLGGRMGVRSHEPELG